MKNRLEYNSVRVSVRVHECAKRRAIIILPIYKYIYIDNYYYYYLCCSQRLRTVNQRGKTIFNNKFVWESQGTRNNLCVRARVVSLRVVYEKLRIFSREKIYRHIYIHIYVYMYKKKKLPKNTLTPRHKMYERDVVGVANVDRRPSPSCFWRACFFRRTDTTTTKSA